MATTHLYIKVIFCITNLISAIPWIGTDVVEFIWGGLNTEEPQYLNILLKILLNAGKSPIFEFAYSLFLIFLSSIILVKFARTWGQSAETRSSYTSDVSQRLYAEDLIYAYLVGLFEGDGFFSISKKGKYLTYELGIELSIRDAKLIYKLKSLLGVGVVRTRKRGNVEMISLRIRNKNHLKNYIFPIFDKYSMFSNKQYDYLRFKNALLTGIIYAKDLPEYTRSNVPLNSIKSIISTDYFTAWLVGFIESEGCFSTYKLKNDYSVASFDISQTGSGIIISAIREYLSFTTQVHLDKTNCFKLKVSSVRSIENIVKFINKAPVKLQGYKKIQFLLWIKELRSIPRYSKKINFPSNY